MVDLNSAIPRAPAGLVLTRALAISEQGEIVANSNAGLVLLKPGRTGTPAPVLGPISSNPDPAVAGVATVLSVPFTDANIKDTHSVTWSWGDGSADAAGAVVESDRAGVASGTHVYSPGVYRISVTVTDSTGRSASAGRSLEVNAP